MGGDRTRPPDDGAGGVLQIELGDEILTCPLLGPASITFWPFPLTGEVQGIKSIPDVPAPSVVRRHEGG